MTDDPEDEYERLVQQVMEQRRLKAIAELWYRLVTARPPVVSHGFCMN